MQAAGRSLAAVMLVWPVVASAAPGTSDGFRHEQGQYLDILREGKPLVRYIYAFDDTDDATRHATYKVYHHVFDPDGNEVITKGPGGLYTHHRGIFIGWSKVGHGGNLYDHWHMQHVNMVHRELVAHEADSNSARVTTLIDWADEQGQPIVEEKRTITVHFTDSDAHLLADIETTLRAVAGEVRLDGDPEHAGFQYRPHNAVAKNKSATYTYHAKEIDLHKDRDLPWVAMTYPLNGKTYTVQHMRHPENPGNSLYSAYRDYGRFGNFFVATIPAGESLRLRYRLRITLGPAPSREVLAAQWNKYKAE